MDRLARVVFVIGLAVLAFGYGYLARAWGLFPHAPLRRGGDAVGAVAKFYLAEDYLTASAEDGARGGVLVLDRTAAAPGPTFLSLYDGERFVGRLVDAEGRTLHEWRASFSGVWGERPPHVRFAGDDSLIQWHGTHLFANGDLLLNFEGHLFPYGGGLVRLDKASGVVWKLARNTHHTVAVAGDGAIWVGAMNYRPVGMAELPGYEPWFYEDVVLKVSPDDGRVLDEISVPLALRASPGLAPRGDGYDPTHLNDVELVTPELAGRFPMLAPGQLVVSLRNLSALVAIDPRAKAATWSMVGPFQRQHDPDLLPDGRVLLFDNLGGDPACGGSRVIALDPVSQEVAWRYDGCVGAEGRPFRSADWGAQQPLPNGNVLITESRRGRVLEVTREARPRIVWEYVNLIGEGRVGIVGESRRVAPGELSFLDPPSS